MATTPTTFGDNSPIVGQFQHPQSTPIADNISGTNMGLHGTQEVPSIRRVHANENQAITRTED
jgi:hypothetical protein